MRRIWSIGVVGGCFFRYADPGAGIYGSAPKPAWPRGAGERGAKPDSAEPGSVEVRAHLGLGVVAAELTESLLLDLAHALARQSDLLADGAERERALAADAEVKARDLGLARGELAEDPLHVDLDGLGRDRLVRGDERVVREHVEEALRGVLRERRVHRERAAAVAEALLHLVRLHVELLGELLDGRLAAVLLLEARARLAHLRERADAVLREADGAGLVRERLQDGLPDPPDGVRDELEAARLVEAARRLHEAVVPLADEVGEAEPLALVLLRHRDDEPEVGADELVQRLLIPLLDPLRELHFLLRSEQLNLTDLIEILVQHPLLSGYVHGGPGNGEVGEAPGRNPSFLWGKPVSVSVLCRIQQVFSTLLTKSGVYGSRCPACTAPAPSAVRI